MKGERISLGGPFRRRSARGLENPAVNECPAELITSLSFPRPSRGVFHIEKLGPKKQRQSGLTLFPLSFPKKDDIRSSTAWSTTDEPHMLNGSIASQCWLIRATMAGLGGDTERERERERELFAVAEPTMRWKVARSRGSAKYTRSRVMVELDIWTLRAVEEIHGGEESICGHTNAGRFFGRYRC